MCMCDLRVINPCLRRCLKSILLFEYDIDIGDYCKYYAKMPHHPTSIYFIDKSRRKKSALPNENLI